MKWRVPWRFWRLKTKLLFLTLFTSTLGIALMCAAVITIENQDYKKHLESELHVISSILAEQSTAALLFNDDKQLSSIISSLSRIDMIRQACVYDIDGELRSAMDATNHALCPYINSPIDVGFVRDHYSLLMPVKMDGDTLGYFYLTAHLDDLKEHIATFVIVAVSVALAILVTLVFVALWLQRMVSKPIQSLSRAAARISRNQDYTVRVPILDRDELGLLGESFNEMIGTIEQQNQRILRSKDELEDKVAERTADLRLANRELEAFSHSISHDLRSPLRAIDGFGQALEEDCKDQLDDMGRVYIDRIRTASVRMGGLIDGLLVLAQVSRKPMEVQTLDLSAMLNDIAQELRDIHPDSTTKVSIQSGLRVTGDSRILRVGFQNLLENAWKYSSKEDAPEIRVYASTNSDGTEVAIQDNGVGFDMRHHEKLFVAFNRLHSPMEFVGTGLGLATVYRIVHRHQGSIRAHSAVGQGATFFVTLPATVKANSDL